MKQNLVSLNEQIGVVNFKIGASARAKLQELCGKTHRSKALMLVYLIENEYERMFGKPAEQAPESTDEDVERRR